MSKQQDVEIFGCPCGFSTIDEDEFKDHLKGNDKRCEV